MKLLGTGLKNKAIQRNSITQPSKINPLTLTPTKTPTNKTAASQNVIPTPTKGKYTNLDRSKSVIKKQLQEPIKDHVRHVSALAGNLEKTINNMNEVKTKIIEEKAKVDLEKHSTHEAEPKITNKSQINCKTEVQASQVQQYEKFKERKSVMVQAKTSEKPKVAVGFMKGIGLKLGQSNYKSERTNDVIKPLPEPTTKNQKILSKEDKEKFRDIQLKIQDKKQRDCFLEIKNFKPNQKRPSTLNQTNNTKVKVPLQNKKQLLEAQKASETEQENHRRITSQPEQDKVVENQNRLEKNPDKQIFRTKEPIEIRKPAEQTFDVKSYTLKRSEQKRGRSKTRSKSRPRHHENTAESPASDKHVKINVTFQSNSDQEKKFEQLADKAKDLDSLELELLKRQDALDFTLSEIRLKEKEYSTMMEDVIERRKVLETKKELYGAELAETAVKTEKIQHLQIVTKKYNQDLIHKEDQYKSKNEMFVKKEKALDGKIKEWDDYDLKVKAINETVEAKKIEIEKQDQDFANKKMENDNEVEAHRQMIKQSMIDIEAKQKLVTKNLEAANDDLEGKTEELTPKDNEIKAVVNEQKLTEKLFDRKNKECMRKVKDCDQKKDELININKDIRIVTAELKKIKPSFEKQKFLNLVYMVHEFQLKPVYKKQANFCRILDRLDNAEKIYADKETDNPAVALDEIGVQTESFQEDKIVETVAKVGGDFGAQTDQIAKEDKTIQINLVGPDCPKAKISKSAEILDRIHLKHKTRIFNHMYSKIHESDTDIYIKSKIFGYIAQTANTRHQVNNAFLQRQAQEKLKKNAGWSFGVKSINGNAKIQGFILQKIQNSHNRESFEMIFDYNQKIVTDISIMKSESQDRLSRSKNEFLDLDHDEDLEVKNIAINFVLDSDKLRYKKMQCKSNKLIVQGDNFNPEMSKRFSDRTFQKKLDEKRYDLEFEKRLESEIDRRLEEKFDEKFEEALDEELLERFSEEEKKGVVAALGQKISEFFSCRKK